MKCFVIMPFEQSFDAVFHTVREVATSAVPEAEFECYWLKDVHAAGRITDDIVNGLSEAAFCIADVTGHNPNVMWETGYAMALGKPTILIGQDTAALPFDLKAHRVLAYTTGREDVLRGKLAEAIRQTLARYALTGSGSAALPSPPSPEMRTIAVTGTMTANEAVVVRRLERALAPYAAETTTWLTGAVGIVDQTAIRALLDRRQKVLAVGYHRFDCAPEVRRLIEEGTLGFLDASLEALPAGVRGPTARDALFCVKADLVILLWDGRSAGTGQLVDYFQRERVATHLVFL